MRILLAIHNAYTDSTSGAAQSMRIIMQWLAEGGHDCRVLATARFDAKPPDSLDAHLASLEVPLRRQPPSKTFIRSVRKPPNVVVGRPTVEFVLDDVPVTMLLTRAQPGSRHTITSRPSSSSSCWTTSCWQFQPDVLVTYGAHPVVHDAMRRARRRGVTPCSRCAITAMTIGVFSNTWTHVFTTSPYLSEVYREQIGLRSVGIDSPIEWDDVEAPDDLRRFVTFVNPTRQKGAMLFARLADMLGSKRPDIPLLVVQSAATAGGLNAIAGLDFTRYPQIMAAPATPRPAEFFALTRILLVPSVFREPFGRVAAEALINGIPPLVSDRGALPQTVRGAGRVLPLPSWMNETTQHVADC